ncbi:GNAT family N-acetyltransferase [Pseudomonas sp. CMR5c]|uniref:GNAT family N-acetyltransferase n=1 Tax=Pseudomonas sp. CMR5c TaxID=658630 RepID=UPI00069DBA5D|nr:GNAT family N-acetyltransferase [Pseudomonas sp. CMR5c]AZC20553.1 Protein export cytoplasm protein SecA ATPase RNA helicase [Pseudomonas sp. CMR5c]
MDRSWALAVEHAENQYLRTRVEGLASISGNPYRASVQGDSSCGAFLVAGHPSPMLNRVHGDQERDAGKLAGLLQACNACNPAIALIAASARIAPTLELQGQLLQRLKGWTHGQFLAPVEAIPASPACSDVESVDLSTLESFCVLHREAFNTPGAARPVTQAAFGALLDDARGHLYLIREQGVAVAGAALFIADNGVAYLGTAFTTKAARGQGHHRALIAHRLHQAVALGARSVAATALVNSQSRRNLEHCGLRLSHLQTLYRAAP